ncbi:Glutaminyl-peptide cyclotransferase [Cyphellophora attinorum]|uniref:Peptide hydrolase n=1 Tax=Cyphellophora attinorum TaxID=1664694 RepID=A0A0N1HYC5_9EURO|nr:Glutaminyl-peptide cyclotransferase [Phialophora attinorum]KPI45814.1 Glutaminyl-peptide cyclotransferase [Phialophora attinorum]
MRLSRYCTGLWLACTALAYSTLSDDTLKNGLPHPQKSDFDIHTGSILAPILIPRVPGTEGSLKVLNHFVQYFRKELPDWTITFQNSTSKTPVHGDKEVPFVNFIATRDPPWTRPGNVARLNLVAHYDSLIKPEGFIGAIDSAAPCAMIMHAVKAIDAALTKKWTSMQTDDFDLDFEEPRGIQVLFLDGEEAFQRWTDTDSIYGARSLAAEWDTKRHPAMSTFKSYLDDIELFVLLDLLGSAENPSIPSWQHTSHWSYVHMAKLEQKLRGLGLFKSTTGAPWLPDADKSETSSFRSYVMQDDHIPFIARGVHVLHLIPGQFPRVWHKMDDNGDNLDIPTVEDWALLTAAFAAEYMELDGFFDPAAHAKRDDVLTSKTEL